MPAQRRDFALIGAGRLGGQLVAHAATRGFSCVRIRRRATQGCEPLAEAHGAVVDSWSAPHAEDWPALIVLSVPDQAIPGTANRLARELDHGERVILHCSGALTAEAAAACRAVGAAVASWHPLQSFPPCATSSAVWDGVPCAIEGDPMAVRSGFTFASDLGLVPWRIAPEDKPRYHAAAVVAGNFCHVLAAVAQETMSGCGLPRTAGGRSGLAPLIEASVEAGLGPRAWQLLTGPVVRGDREVVEGHLAVLPRAEAEVYRAMVELIARHGASDCED